MRVCRLLSGTSLLRTGEEGTDTGFARVASNHGKTFAQLSASGRKVVMTAGKVPLLILLGLCAALAIPTRAQTAENPADLPQRDGSHDFDFLIGDWKAHVRRLPDRLDHSDVWVVYDGISNHHKLLDSNANFEEFDVITADKKLRIKAQTLRLYNPATRQWSIYLVNLDNGTLDVPPVVGGFTGNRGEFFHQEQLKGRTILVRYVWLDLSPKSSRMEQSYSPDGGKTWEVNWICELSR